MSVPFGTLTVGAVYEALDRVKDPCMVATGHDLSILDLGLVYEVEVQEGGRVRIDMTLTELGCIFTHRVFGEVYDAVEALPGVKEVEAVPRWSPVWTPERLNEKATRALADSRSAMFHALKGRGLERAKLAEDRPEEHPTPLAGHGVKDY